MGKMRLFLSTVCAALIQLSDISELFPVEFLKTLKSEELIKSRKYCHCQWVYEPFFGRPSFYINLFQIKELLAIITEYGEKIYSTLNKYLLATDTLSYNFNNLKSLNIFIKNDEKPWCPHFPSYSNKFNEHFIELITHKTLKKRIWGWIWHDLYLWIAHILVGAPVMNVINNYLVLD